jgi:general secretion pathway protein M
MIANLVGWWQLRSRREQVLLGIMLALAALTLAWLLVIRPLGDARASARERHEAAIVALAEARAQAQAIGRIEGRRAPRLEGALMPIVSASANEAGFALSRITPDGDNRVSLSMSAAKPQAFFAWLDRLETERGLVVERVNVTSNSDRTLSVELTVRTRGE